MSEPRPMPATPEPPTIVDLIRRRAAERPDATAFVFLAEGEEESDRLDRAELERRVRRLAVLLAARGLRGERALLLFPPGLEFVVAFLACLEAGVVTVPAYPPGRRRGADRLAAIVRDAAPRVALTLESLASRFEPWRAMERAPELLAIDGAAARREAAEAGDRPLPPPRAADLAFLQYTSGSTSTPKGVRVSHRNLVHNEEAIRRAFGQSADSVVISWLPLYHDMGLIGSVLQPLYVGAPCVLMAPAAFLRRPVRWLRAIGRYGATTSGGPNFAYDLCVDKIADDECEGLDLSSWQVAFNGAEPVQAQTLERFTARFARHGFRHRAHFPCYGLAEATLLVSGGPLAGPPRLAAFDRDELAAGVARPARGSAAALLAASGGAAAGCRVEVVDSETARPRREGEVGEIWLAGPSVADGYWRRPEDTEETFGARLPGRDERFLRTGDLGFLRGGELFVTGRIKDLIIVRGRNHYPQDLERTARASHPGVEDGAAAAFVAPVDGGDGLVLVLEARRRPPVDIDEVGESVRGAVAREHDLGVVEVVVVPPGGVPRTTSGKVRRAACRGAYLAGELPVLGRSGAVGLADSDELEAVPAGLARRLRDRVARVLGVEPPRVRLDLPLAALGIDSVQVLELQAALVEEGFDIPLEDLLDSGGVSELAVRCEARGQGDEAAGEEPSAAAHDAAPAPLSYGQRSLWVIEWMTRDASENVIAAAARLPAGADLERLVQACDRLVERHPSLRSVFGGAGADVVVETAPRGRCEVGELATVEGETPDELLARLSAAAYRPFDLAGGPWVRLLVARSGGGMVLGLAVHHIVVDFWSLVVLLRELGELYAGRPLPPPPQRTYADFARRQAAVLAGGAGERLWGFWQGQLEGGPPDLELPVDRPRPPVRSSLGGAWSLDLDRELSDGLCSLARQGSATPYAVLLAAFEVLLWRVSGQEDFAVGTLAAGRTAPEWAGVVGYFVNPLVLRSDVGVGRGEQAAGFAPLVGRVHARSRAALAHQEMPFPLLAEHLRPQRDASRTPLFQVLFVLQKAHLPGTRALSAFALGAGGGRAELGGLELEELELPRRPVQFDLMLMVAETEGGYRASFQYSAALFDRTSVGRLARRFEALLAAAVEDPRLPLGSLPLLTAAERQQMLREWNDTGVREGAVDRLDALVLERAAAVPDAVAVVAGGAHLSYGELDRRSAALAAELAARTRGAAGPRVQVRIAVCLERDCELIVALLAVLRAGAAYVPLDPAHPAERLRGILADAGADLLIRSPHLVPHLDPPCPVVPLDLARGDAGEAPAAVGGTGGGDALAYVIFTSGSTGRPKGVAMSHAGVVHRVTTAPVVCGGLDRPATWTLFHSIAFDFSVWELWTPLVHGGRLVVVPDLATRSPDELVRLWAREAVEVAHLTPSTARQVADTLGEARFPAALRLLGCGGEALPADLAARLAARVPALWNFYGPTEAAVWCAATALRPRGEELKVRLGRPLPGDRLLVLDRRLQVVPTGSAGELAIGGAGVARGYLGRPGLTAERFVPDPHGSPGSRLYRTGDLVRVLAGGELEFLGRLDHQVKVSGYRIELGEVEAALAQHPSVRRAVVESRPAPGGEHRLVAYYESAGAASAAALAAFLRRRLPPYMVPSLFVPLASLPLSSNRKVDRAALPEPSVAGLSGGASPRTATEELVAGIWEEVLGVGGFDRESDFFAAGGHSVLATRVVLRAREALGADLRVADLFAAPTLCAFAARVDAARRERSLPHRPPLVAGEGTGDAPLSFAQHRLWFSNRLHPRDPGYNVSGAAELAGQLDLGALRAALALIVERHRVLRTVFPLIDGQPVQRVLPGRVPVAALVDLTSLPVAARRGEGLRLARGVARGPFDLERDLLLRVAVVRLDGLRHLLLLATHHIASDLWSLRVLLREVEVHYAALHAGERPALPPLPVQYADFARWQRRWLDEDVMRAHLEPLRRRLRDLPELDLPTDRPRPERYGFWGAAHPFTLPPPLTAALEALARREGATLFMVLLAGAHVVLHAATGQEDIVVGTNVANRSALELEGLIGLFINQLVLRSDLAGDPSFRGLVARARESLLAAELHQDLPFERLVEELRPKRSGDRPLLFRVKVELESEPPALPALPGLEARLLEPDRSIVRYDLHFYMERFAAPTGSEVRGWLQYKPRIFDPDRIERMARQLVVALEAAADDPELPLSLLRERADAVERQHRSGEKDRFRDALSRQLSGLRRRAPSTPTEPMSM